MALLRKKSNKPQTTIEDEPVPMDTAKTGTKFSKPKILLLDVGEDASSAVRAGWVDVVDGTLGTPYEVKQSSGYLQVVQWQELIGHEEADIVVVDLSVGEVDKFASGDPHRPAGELDLWSKCDRGLIDNRVRSVIAGREAFQRILEQGGIYVVFASPPVGGDLFLGRSYGSTLAEQTAVESNVWSLTSELDDITVTQDAGQTMTVTHASSIGTILAKYLPGSHFDCTLTGGYRREHPWETLAKNKFGESVALARVHETGGVTIVVPQLADKAGFLTDLLSIALPDISPALFPEMAQGKWVHRPEYELPRVLELQRQKQIIEQEARDAVTKIEADVTDERSKNGWLHDLVAGTGDPLVLAVQKALSSIGFKKVIDVDEERDRLRLSRREDLRIDDESPLLVVDIKGIGGYPSDDDVTQANKHALINMKELSRTDIQGLAIINSQRHLPPLERENNMPFRQELLDMAGETSLGLLTAFDLYRIVANTQKHGWDSSVVRPLFYRAGRIEVVPAHYRYLGTVAKVMTEKFGVVIAENEIEVGDSISVEGPIFFEQVPVSSIQVDSVVASKATLGQRAGFLWPDNLLKLRAGMRFFAGKKETQVAAS